MTVFAIDIGHGLKITTRYISFIARPSILVYEGEDLEKPPKYKCRLHKQLLTARQLTLLQGGAAGAGGAVGHQSYLPPLQFCKQKKTAHLGELIWSNGDLWRISQ